MSTLSRKQRKRIRDRNEMEEYRREIDQLKEQIGGFKVTLVKREQDVELAEREKQQVKSLNTAMRIANQGIMEKAECRALQVCLTLYCSTT